jgi:ABC-type dipeptide/oligopeptide/nickel transport system permease subunit
MLLPNYWIAGGTLLLQLGIGAVLGLVLGKLGGQNNSIVLKLATILYIRF